MCKPRPDVPAPVGTTTGRLQGHRTGRVRQGVLLTDGGSSPGCRPSARPVPVPGRRFDRSAAPRDAPDHPSLAAGAHPESINRPAKLRASTPCKDGCRWR